MRPMLATPGALPHGPGWMFEVEWDGLRLLADVADGRLQLVDGDGADRTGVFPELAGAAALAPDVLLDGVVVVLADGVPSAAALAARLCLPHPAGSARCRPPCPSHPAGSARCRPLCPSHPAGSARCRPPCGEPRRATYLAFDVLRLYGVALLDRPFGERRGTLERLPFDGGPNAAVTRSPVYSDGTALLAAAARRGLPGLVAKRRESVYRPGARCADWLRVRG